MIRRPLVLVSVLACAVAGVFGSPAPASATPSTEVIQGAVLRLVSVADWDAASSMLPGRPVQWDVTVSADATEPGTVTIGVSAVGDAPLVLDVSSCGRSWTPEGCRGGATPVRSGWNIVGDGEQVVLATMSDDDTLRLRLSVVLASDGVGGRTDVRFHARGLGESVTVGSAGVLAATGVAPGLPWWLGGGVGLVAVGAFVASRRGRGQGRIESEMER